ncbi:MAG: 1-acyl-sn-glycerol-3-phosphate acyltransferase [Deltaproteobacteria bacterium]|nr:1-acyl-sn-glycerol-3-phosphate acyltransferase [Deltaproteobacteria bacterium]
MRWIRSLATWTFAVVWTALILGSSVVVSVLTLGLLRHRLINVAGPAWAWPVLWVAGIRMDLHGMEHLAGRQARLLVMNHQSIIEILAIAAMSVPGFSPLGKKQIKWVPAFGQAWWALGGHFVDRGHHKKAVGSLQRLAQDMKRHGLTAVIAPEGTRSRTGQLQKFKMGAFHLAIDVGVPMVPVVFHNGFQLCRPDSLLVQPGTFWVDVHPPIDTSSWTRDGLRAQADALHDRYAAWLAAGPLPRS